MLVLVHVVDCWYLVLLKHKMGAAWPLDVRQRPMMMKQDIIAAQHEESSCVR